ncbi:MAG: hypothetical protein JW910_14530 [Anaerolineae bacterium]|nr:hypothetical protein [Anaerolineae bacterium]
MPVNPELDHELLIQRLIQSVSCTACDGLYGPDDVYVLADDVDTWTLLAVCPLCGTESMVLAYLDDAHVVSEVMPPDLAEVAAWRCFLAAFDGDLRDLLRL